jgi:Fe2+ or Zn2+ uptake regulation protein
MHKEHLIAKGTVQAFIKQRNQFTYEEVHNEIIKRGGTARVATCVTIKDYLETFENNGVLKFVLDEKDGHYCVVKKSLTCTTCKSTNLTTYKGDLGTQCNDCGTWI